MPERETAGLLPVFFLGSWSSAAIVSVYAADGTHRWPDDVDGRVSATVLMPLSVKPTYEVFM